MNVIMYGMNICPDCTEAMNVLQNHADITVEYREFTQATTHLKEFLKYRDTNSLFDKVKDDGNIGIPLFVMEDGFITLDVFEVINRRKQ
ncbi:glutaredoxin [Lachnoclostridium phytofermentans]|uniref:Glutaredoxin-like protein n=1 Tax=Lachnoclostridium phytofermentans (strain ATCC 700394 / DSM 18823 / ISDg) TaxID=357809 RepID=A9KNQ4_LACP7|nr:glutaredoxin [Lachnoclostridium phytofermentans]ABX41655.1 glutaredoxin-like protein [Lachnoclostridium phytofermentans ISDg]